MECPKCRAKNSDDAEFCGLCFEKFQRRSSPRAGAPDPDPDPVPAAKPAPSAGGLAVLARVNSTIKHTWTGDEIISGPVVVREDGIYYFILEFKNQATEMVKERGLIGMAIGSYMESTSDDQPKDIDCHAVAAVPDIAQAARSSAPDITACRLYFMVPRSEITSLKSGGFFSGGGTELRTRTLHIGMDITEEDAVRIFPYKGYPWGK